MRFDKPHTELHLGLSLANPRPASILSVDTHPSGRFVTAGLDGCVRIWKLRLAPQFHTKVKHYHEVMNFLNEKKKLLGEFLNDGFGGENWKNFCGKNGQNFSTQISKEKSSQIPELISQIQKLNQALNEADLARRQYYIPDFLSEFNTHSGGSPLGVKFSPNGQLLAVLTDAKRLEIWTFFHYGKEDVETIKKSGEKNLEKNIDENDDIQTKDLEREIGMYNVETWCKIHDVTIPSDSPIDLIWTNDSNGIFFSQQDSSVLFFRLDLSKIEKIDNLVGENYFFQKNLTTNNEFSEHRNTDLLVNQYPLILRTPGLPLYEAGVNERRNMDGKCGEKNNDENKISLFPPPQQQTPITPPPLHPELPHSTLPNITSSQTRLLSLLVDITIKQLIFQLEKWDKENILEKKSRSAPYESILSKKNSYEIPNIFQRCLYYLDYNDYSLLMQTPIVDINGDIIGGVRDVVIQDELGELGVDLHNLYSGNQFFVGDEKNDDNFVEKNGLQETSFDRYVPLIYKEKHTSLLEKAIGYINFDGIINRYDSIGTNGQFYFETNLKNLNNEQNGKSGKNLINNNKVEKKKTPLSTAASVNTASNTQFQQLFPYDYNLVPENSGLRGQLLQSIKKVINLPTENENKNSNLSSKKALFALDDEEDYSHDNDEFGKNLSHMNDNSDEEKINFENSQTEKLTQNSQTPPLSTPPTHSTTTTKPTQTLTNTPMQPKNTPISQALLDLEQLLHSNQLTKKEYQLFHDKIISISSQNFDQDETDKINGVDNVFVPMAFPQRNLDRFFRNWSLLSQSSICGDITNLAAQGLSMDPLDQYVAIMSDGNRVDPPKLSILARIKPNLEEYVKNIQIKKNNKKIGNKKNKNENKIGENNLNDNDNNDNDNDDNDDDDDDDSEAELEHKLEDKSKLSPFEVYTSFSSINEAPNGLEKLLQNNGNFEILGPNSNLKNDFSPTTSKKPETKNIKLKNQHLFSQERFELFYRRPDWSPDGLLLATPSGILPIKQQSLQSSKQTTQFDLTKDNDNKHQNLNNLDSEQGGKNGNDDGNGIKFRREFGDANHEEKNCVHIFTRIQIRKRSTAPCISLPTPFNERAVAVQFNPIPFVSKGTFDNFDKLLPNNDQNTPSPSTPIRNPSLTGTGYYYILAVATATCVALYRTDIMQPVACFNNLHHRPITQISWFADGLKLIISSQDSRCSFITINIDQDGRAKWKWEGDDEVNIIGDGVEDGVEDGVGNDINAVNGFGNDINGEKNCGMGSQFGELSNINKMPIAYETDIGVALYGFPKFVYDTYLSGVKRVFIENRGHNLKQVAAKNSNVIKDACNSSLYILQDFITDIYKVLFGIKFGLVSDGEVDEVKNVSKKNLKSFFGKNEKNNCQNNLTFDEFLLKLSPLNDIFDTISNNLFGSFSLKLFEYNFNHKNDEPKIDFKNDPKKIDSKIKKTPTKLTNIGKGDVLKNSDSSEQNSLVNRFDSDHFKDVFAVSTPIKRKQLTADLGAATILNSVQKSAKNNKVLNSGQNDQKNDEQNDEQFDLTDNVVDSFMNLTAHNSGINLIDIDDDIDITSPLKKQRTK
jgi:hypothetical protein